MLFLVVRSGLMVRSGGTEVVRTRPDAAERRDRGGAKRLMVRRGGDRDPAGAAASRSPAREAARSGGGVEVDVADDDLEAS